MSEYVPGLQGVPAARSSISYVDGLKGILEYRGIRIEDLAKQSNFEEVTFLLLHQRLPTESELKEFSDALNNERQLPPGVEAVIDSFPETAHPMDALQTGIAALGMFSTPGDVTDPGFRETEALRIIAKIPTVAAAFHRARNGLEALEPDTSLSHPADFLRMLTGDVPDRLSAHVMDVCFVLHADHTMNASTFAARVTASTQSDPYAVVTSAIGSLSGPLHGGANEGVLLMLRNIASKEKVRPFVEDMIARGQRIMGLGHRVYKTKDPRAIILQALAGEIFEKRGKSDVYDIAVELEKVAKELLASKGIYPNVDFYSGIVYDRLGIPSDMYTPIFAIARSTGWLAHWLEQMSDNRLYRPTQIYDGPHNVPYIPISDR